MVKINEALEKVARDYFNCAKSDIHYQDQAGGFSAVSNLVLTVKNKKYLLRCLPEKQSLESRTKEVKISQHAANMDLAPEVFFVNDNYSIALIDFIEGNTFGTDEINNDHIINQLKVKLDKLYNSQSPVTDNAKQIIDGIVSGFHSLNNCDVWLNIFSDDIFQWQKFTNEKSQKTSGLIHNDLNGFNLIIDNSERIWLIDWTDSGRGQIASDLAMIDIQRKVPFFDDQLINNYKSLRLFNLTCWSLVQAQINNNELEINPSILKDSDTIPPLATVFDGILCHTTRLKTSTNFLALTPIFYHHYQASLS